MAIRPIYEVTDDAPFYKVHHQNFVFYSGFSISQKQKSINSLHSSFRRDHPHCSVLEVSSKSNQDVGVKLSAFNLMINTNKRTFSVECAFQSSKVFESNGPFTDILQKTSKEAKRDERLKTNGALKEFNYFGNIFPLDPPTYFYNWLYINALYLNKSLLDDIETYDAFTDIEFNENKSINCQAMAAAIYVGLKRSGKLLEALKDKNSFLKIVYGR